MHIERAARAAVVAAGALALSACERAIPPPIAKQESAAFICDAAASREPEALRRLTMTQYRNTIRDLARWAVGDALEAEVIAAMTGLDRVPEDRAEPTSLEPHGSYRRLDQAIDQAHVDATYEVSSAIALQLTAPERIGRVVGACAIDADAGNDEACITELIERFGARALRAPLAADDALFYRSIYGSEPAPRAEAYAAVLSAMLSAPQLLYFVEHAGAAAADDPGSYQLSPYELASRLSYHFWQTLPDDELWARAQDGSLVEPAVLERQVDRLLADPRTRATMEELFTDWLQLERLAPLASETLRASMVAEVLDMLAHYTWVEPAGLFEVFTSERSFARSAELAAIYGIAPWDGASAPPALPPGQRPGLLTRALFLATGTDDTRPIMKGVLIRRQLLCDQLAPPPPGASAIQPMARAGLTTRQAVEQATEQPGTVCASCHETLINPLGFVFEGYDSQGRVRTSPVDTRVTPRITPRITPDDARSIETPAELARLILESGKLEACLARHYFRFTFGRYEDLNRDGCVLERLLTRLREGGIRSMLREVALLPELRRRTFE